MFKALANLLHRTPWWGLAFIGLFTFVALVVFFSTIAGLIFGTI